MERNARSARPNTTRLSTARRAARLALMNAGLFGGALLLVWLGSVVLHRPTGTEPRVGAPAGMVRGAAPGPLASGDYRVLLSDANWIPQSQVPADAVLSFRARPDALVDYLVLGVTVANTGPGPLALTYLGAGQDVRLLLTSSDPEPFARDPLSPAEAVQVAGRPGLANGPLAAGERRSGVLVYAVERTRRAFALWAVPAYAPGQTPDQGPQTPAVELRFRP